VAWVVLKTWLELGAVRSLLAVPDCAQVTA
jgi:hypothetical protein